jgi:multiple sugar transport system substrate-binding protein
MAVELRGSSWNHERGHAPMVATAAEYERMTGGAVRVHWEPRSLKEFGVASVADLCRSYDLVVMDHPHIGLIAQTGVAVPLGDVADPARLAELAAASPGRSHESYHYGGQQWGLAIDAACQVSARRPDLLPEPPRTWDQVLELSREGRVLWPLCDVDSAASMLTLMAGLGSPVTLAQDDPVDRETWLRALGLLREVAAASDPRCLRMNPIDVLEVLSATDDFWYAPLIFGYSNYSRRGRRDRPLAFGDIPALGPASEPAGALLGGAGLVVSAASAHRAEAVDYAMHVAAPQTQRATYFTAGGQPAHHAAWSDPAVDAASGGFFSGTGPAMESSWTRPRMPAFVGFQNEMIELFGRPERWMESPGSFTDEFEACYRRYAVANSADSRRQNAACESSVATGICGAERA